MMTGSALAADYQPGGGLTLEDDSGDNSLNIQGLYSYDSGFFDGGSPAFDHQKNAVRDEIINLTGVLAHHWRFQFAYDVADRSDPPDTPYKNVTLTYAFDQLPLIVTLGNQKVPFSQQHLNGVPQLVFAERGLPFALAPRRRLGLSAGVNGEDWQMQGGTFTTNINRDYHSNDRAWAVRATRRFPTGPDSLVHMGGAFEYDDPSSDADSGPVTFGFQPETLLAGRALVGSGPLRDASAVRKYNLELGGKRGPLTLQSEFHVARIDTAGRDVQFQGGYAQASWLLTGESRPYMVAKGPMLRGVFSRPKVTNPVDLAHPFSSGGGAVELAARYSALDLEDGNVGGGKQQSATLGVNWFLNATLRLTANYIHAESDERTGADEHVDAWVARAEVRF